LLAVAEDNKTLRLRPIKVTALSGSGPRAFADGDLIAARYRVLRFIAKGGMGEVYAAHDQMLDEAVALKTLRAELAADAQSLARFRREIRLARKVSHPNVCRVFDLAMHEGVAAAGALTVRARTWFLTMELLDGETLSERIRRDGPFAPDAALAIVAQLCAALDALHAQPIVHRDIKSGNVMLTGGRVVLTDFGLARTPGRSEVTTTPAMLGTPVYMAPEQLEGGEATPASDLYALGVVLYELVTGQLPFAADNAPEAAALRRKTEPPSPRRWVPSLDDKWERAILRCLARTPGERFACAADLFSALR
jgi:serine/threonine protein kinase